MEYPSNLEYAEPPETWQVCVDGIFIKQMPVMHKGGMVGQHVHAHDHHTMLATGSVRVWVDMEWMGDFKAPRPIFIAKGKQHAFQALEDNTLCYCVHNTHGSDDVEILAKEY